MLVIRDLVDVFLRELRDLCGDFTAVKKVNLPLGKLPGGTC